MNNNEYQVTHNIFDYRGTPWVVQKGFWTVGFYATEDAAYAAVERLVAKKDKEDAAANGRLNG
jgi:hypothetical protein